MATACEEFHPTQVTKMVLEYSRSGVLAAVMLSHVVVNANVPGLCIALTFTKCQDGLMRTLRSARRQQAIKQNRVITKPGHECTEIDFAR